MQQRHQFYFLTLYTEHIKVGGYTSEIYITEYCNSVLSLSALLDNYTDDDALALLYVTTFSIISLYSTKRVIALELCISHIQRNPPKLFLTVHGLTTCLIMSPPHFITLTKGPTAGKFARPIYVYGVRPLSTACNIYTVVGLAHKGLYMEWGLSALHETSKL